MRKGKVIFAGVLVGVFLLTAACAAPETKKNTAKEETAADGAAGQTEEAYHKITAEEAKKILDNEDVILVDVRTQEEYTQSHIPNAILIPNETIKEEPPKELEDKEAKILVYCRTGVRSRQASEKLVDMGYQQIYDMGGIADWPYETESGEKSS